MKPAVIAVILWLASTAPEGAPGAGSRFRQVSITVGHGPRWITVADVNNDRHPDIVVANDADGTITVLLGDGKGAFHPSSGSPFPAGHLPNDIAAADMNGDGNLDLVIANHQSPYLTVLLGDGKGGFHPAPGSPFDVHSNPHPHGIVVADFNGVGKADAATDSWGSNQIELLLGDGTGRLRTPGRYFAVGRRPYERLRSADFNHDGIPDVVTSNLDDGTVSILLGDGKGGFRNAAGSPFPAGAKPWQVAVDDFDGDGNPDLILIPYQRDIASPKENAVTVLLGDGKGAFKPMPRSPFSLQGCRGPNGVAAGDLRGDGSRAIVVACAESRSLSVFERGRDGKIVMSSVPSRGGWGGVAVARLTGDRRAQIITADNDAGTVTIYFPQ
jgi:FG-GAP-like repeat